MSGTCITYGDARARDTASCSEIAYGSRFRRGSLSIAPSRLVPQYAVCEYRASRRVRVGRSPEVPGGFGTWSGCLWEPF
eukprot:3934135-Rhodomonas_salina.1